MTVAGSEVLLKLVKAVSEVWPRLTQEHQKPVHVSIDFDRWEDKEIGILGGTILDYCPVSTVAPKIIFHTRYTKQCIHIQT